VAKNFTYFIGLRYLNAKKQGFLSIISFISFAGIALGVTALVVVTSVMNGFHQDIRDKIIGTNAHVVAMPYDARAGMAGYREKVKNIMDLPHVKSAAPYFMGQVMLKYVEKVEGLLLWGVIPESISKVNKLRENMIKGDVDSIMKTLPGGEQGILLGKELMNTLGAEMGDEIILISPVFQKTPAGLMPKMSKMKIVGVFEAGMYDYDSTFAYVSIKTAQELYGKGDVITGIAIKTDDLENAGIVATEIHRKYKDLWARQTATFLTFLSYRAWQRVP
jgi:lipoprotein-releasing system permease protein